MFTIDLSSDEENEGDSNRYVWDMEYKDFHSGDHCGSLPLDSDTNIRLLMKYLSSM